MSCLLALAALAGCRSASPRAEAEEDVTYAPPPGDAAAVDQAGSMAVEDANALRLERREPPPSRRPPEPTRRRAVDQPRIRP